MGRREKIPVGSEPHQPPPAGVLHIDLASDSCNHISGFHLPGVPHVSQCDRNADEKYQDQRCQPPPQSPESKLHDCLPNREHVCCPSSLPVL